MPRLQLQRGAYDAPMLSLRTSLVAVALVAACAPPKQAPLPEIGEDSELDPGASAPKSDGEAAGPAEEGGEDPVADEKAAMHEKCCQNCLEALAKDKSGMSADELPCADYTTELSPWCLEHFRDNPTKVSECQAAGAAESSPAP
jgi:hypothetical protein